MRKLYFLKFWIFTINDINNRIIKYRSINCQAYNFFIDESLLNEKKNHDKLYGNINPRLFNKILLFLLIF